MAARAEQKSSPRGVAFEFRFSFSSEHHATLFLPDSHFVAQGLQPNDPYGA